MVLAIYARHTKHATICKLAFSSRDANFNFKILLSFWKPLLEKPTVTVAIDSIENVNVRPVLEVRKRWL